MNKPDAPSLSFQVMDALGTFASRLEAALEPIGLSLAKFGILSKLVDAGEPLPLSTLAERSACVRSNITQLVDRLEADKLVIRVDDPHDRRLVRATLTSEGRARHAAGARALAEAERALVPGDRHESLLRLLEVLRARD
jgi:MarR family transcriptional regulator, transcriptional regulator for hemolysin